MNSTLRFFALALLVAPVSPSWAQSVDESSPPIPAGSHALEFQVRNLVSLGSFFGGTISYKYYLPNHAVRIGLSVNQDFYDRTGDRTDRREFVELDSLIVEDFDVGDKQALRQAVLQSQLLFYGGNRQRVETYWGLGPLIGYSRRDLDRKTWPQDTTETRLRTSGYEYTRITEDYYVGVVASVGFEWSWRKHLGVVAEYSSTVHYGKSRFSGVQRSKNWWRLEGDTILVLDEERERSSGPLISFSSGVKFGVVVWF